MNKILLESIKTADQEGTDITLTYYLLEEQEEDPAQYGAEIVMHRGGQEECASCRRVTPLAARMRALLGVLAAQTVTPVNLQQCLMDLL